MLYQDERKIFLNHLDVMYAGKLDYCLETLVGTAKNAAKKVHHTLDGETILELRLMDLTDAELKQVRDLQAKVAERWLRGQWQKLTDNCSREQIKRKIEAS